jgi:hypothetical protein
MEATMTFDTGWHVNPLVGYQSRMPIALFRPEGTEQSPLSGR